MESLLAIIGLIFIIHWLGKQFTKLGNMLESISESIAEKSASTARTELSRKKAMNDIKKAKEKVRVMQKDNADAEYMDNVRKEIDEML